MEFLFWLANHTKLGQRSLEDVIGIVGHQLRALGHTATWDPENKSFLTGDRGYNVVVEGFTPGVVEVMARGYQQGARFICLATEEPTPRGFNHGTQREMTLRQELFPAAAPYLDAIWHLVPGQGVTDWYAQHAPSAYVELGWASSLVRPQFRRPTFDFGFYGSMSTRRLKWLRKLARRSGKPQAVRVMADFQSQHDRDLAMQEAKVIVQIRKFDRMGLVSSSRCNTALCIGRPVVAEPHELSKPWDEVVLFAREKGDFVNLCMKVLADWQRVHQQQMFRFAEKFPPSACVGAAVDLVSAPRRAAA